MITEFTSFVSVSFIQDGNESTLKSQNESRGLNVDLLGLLDVLAEVLDLHDVVLGDKGVNLLSLFVDETSVFELSSQVQLQLNLKFVFEDSVDPLL